MFFSLMQAVPAPIIPEKTTQQHQQHKHTLCTDLNLQYPNKNPPTKKKIKSLKRELKSYSKTDKKKEKKMEVQNCLMMVSGSKDGG
jgi:hypothetical protein